MRNKALDDFGKLQLDLIQKIDKGEISRNEAQFKVEEFWIGGLRKAVVDGDIDYGSLMAGQSVGLINKSETINDILTDIADNMEKELLRVKKLLA